MITLPDLPYAYDALEPFIDGATMRVHHAGHHAAYIKNLQELVKSEQSLEELVKSPNPKIRNNAGGVLNHNFFWTIMSPPGQTMPSRYESIVDPFSTAALGLFGSGWVWLVLSEVEGLKIITTPNQDVPDQKVILGLDLWEHAYYLKYQNRRAEYIKNWWNVVNWKQVEKNIH